MYGLACLALALAGCGSAPSVPSLPSASGSGAAGTAPAAESSGILGYLGGLSDKALEAVGLKKPEVPEMPEIPNIPDSALPDRRIAWRVFASDSLNVTDRGQSLALVVRMYKLKSPDAFLQAPYDTFGDPAKEKAALNEDLVAARELQLVPGQHYEATDKVSREARFVGIVALYRNPLQGRWRYAFNAAAAEKTGLHLGAHACAMSVQVGEAIGQPASAVRSVALPCPKGAPVISPNNESPESPKQ
jgi:type VI secretion system protein VasD